MGHYAPEADWKRLTWDTRCTGDWEVGPDRAGTARLRQMSPLHQAELVALQDPTRCRHGRIPPHESWCLRCRPRPAPPPGTTPWELPEALLGTLRLYNLDTRKAVLIDVDNEIPLRPPTVSPYQPPPSRQQQQRCSPPPPTPPAGASPLRAGRRGSPSGGAGGGDVNGEEERASPGGLGRSSGHTVSASWRY